MKAANQSFSKSLITFWSTIFLFVFYSEASAIQTVQYRQPTDAHAVKGWVTSDVASRATSDVELRRLMRLFYAKKIDSEDLYKHLRKLRSKP